VHKREGALRGGGLSAPEQSPFLPIHPAAISITALAVP
jgi:hypothetical protein